MATEPLDTLQLKIESDASAAAEGLKSLQDALRKLRNSLSRSKPLNLGPIADEISKFSSAVNSVNIDNIVRLADAMSQIQKASNGFASGIRKASKAAGAAKYELGFYNPESGRSSRSSRSSAGGYAPEDVRNPYALSPVNDREVHWWEHIQKEQEEEGTERQTQGYEKVLATAKRVFSGIVDSAKTSFRVITNLVIGIGKAFLRVGEIAKTAFLSPLKLIGNGISKIYKSVNSLIRSIARIALYRAIRTAIKAVTQGLNEGIQNLYQWSLIMDKTFANSMNSIATSMQYLHNGFAAMFSPLIEYAAPILEEITNRLVDFFNTVQQIFASLTGQSTWTKAVRVQKQYAEAVTDTGNAAEKAMHQVMAFDELNIINSPSAGGSGSGSNIPDYGSMFTTETVDTQLANWVEEIRKFFEGGQFEELGKFVGEKLNGVVSKWEAYADGFKFGEKIKHALEALNGFLETFNFYELGTKFGNWLSGFVDGVTPEELRDAIVNLFNSAISTGSGFVDSLIAHNIPGKIGQAIGTAFADFDWEGFVNLSRKIIIGIVDILNTAIGSFIANGGPAKLIDSMGELGLAIGEAFATFDWEGSVTVITSIFTGLVNMLTSAISSFVENGGPANLRSAMGQIGVAIGNAFASIPGRYLVEIFNSIAGGLLDMFKNAFKALTSGGTLSTQLREFVQGLRWGDVLQLAAIPLTISVAFSLVKGIGGSLLALILSSLGLSAAALGPIAGLVTLTAAGLALALTISVIYELLNDPEEPKPPTPEEVARAQQEAARIAQDNYMSGGAVVESKRTAWQEIGDFFSELWEDIKSGLQMSTYVETMMTPGLTDEKAKDITGQYIIAEANRQATNELVDVNDQLSDLLDIYNDWDKNGGNPFRLRGPGGGGGGLLWQGMVKYSVDSNDFGDAIIQKMISETPSVAAEAMRFGKKTGDAIKNGANESNVPEAFRKTATASLDAFGSVNFTAKGRAWGDQTKQGMSDSNIAGHAASLANSVVGSFQNATGSFYNNGYNSGVNFGNGLKNGVAAAAHSVVSTTPAGKQDLIARIAVMANGGYAQGGLFLAGEVAGQAEMVGSINGRTGVASGEEITGIREAVVASGNEEAALLRQQNQLLQALLVKDPFGTPNSAAGRWIAQSSQAYKAVTG